MGVLSKVTCGLLGKSKKRDDGREEQSGGVSPSSAPAAKDLTSPPTPTAPASGLAKPSPMATITIQPPPEPVAPSVPQPPNPAPTPSAQQTVSDTFSSNDIDPWHWAYEIVQEREDELMADYKKHLASPGVDAAASADISTLRSVESIVNKLWEDREKKQWRVSLLGKDIKVRKQAERLTKFLLWSDPIVKTAVSAQPYAALAWSGVSLLLPVRK